MRLSYQCRVRIREVQGQKKFILKVWNMGIVLTIRRETGCVYGKVKSSPFWPWNYEMYMYKPKLTRAEQAPMYYCSMHYCLIFCLATRGPKLLAPDKSSGSQWKNDKFYPIRVTPICSLMLNLWLSLHATFSAVVYSFYITVLMWHWGHS